MTKYYAYVCNGCSYTTAINKSSRTKTIHCANCGDKKEMQKLGECIVSLVEQPNVFNPIH